MCASYCFIASKPFLVLEGSHWKLLFPIGSELDSAKREPWSDTERLEAAVGLPLSGLYFQVDQRRGTLAAFQHRSCSSVVSALWPVSKSLVTGSMFLQPSTLSWGLNLSLGWVRVRVVIYFSFRFKGSSCFPHILFHITLRVILFFLVVSYLLPT